MSRTPLKTVSVIGAVVEALSQSIMSNEYTPGERISESSLAARFEVPRPTVRSALALLQEQGLLRREPNRSVYVPRFGREDIEEIFSMRLLIEAEAVRRLAAGPGVPEDATRAFRILAGLQYSNDWSLFVEYDFALHRALVEGVGSERLARLYRSISAETRLALSQLRPCYEDPTGLAAEHAQILGAIADGDEAAAVAAVGEHTRETEQILLRMLERDEERPTPAA